MPFQYQDSRAPAAGSIAELMLRRGDIAAQQAQQVGAAQARAAEARGNAWASAAQNIGQSVAAIPGQMQQAKTQALQTQALQQNVDQGARVGADLKALDNAYMQPGGREAIINALPGHLRPTVQKQFADADEAAAKVQETQLKVTEAQNDYLGGLAANIRDHGYEPNAAQLAISHAKTTYAGNPDMLKQIGQIEQQFQSNPATIKPIVDQLVGVSAKQKAADAAALTAQSRAQSSATGAAKFELEKPKIALETQKVGQEVAGTVPMTQAQQAQQARDAERLGLEKQRVGLEGARVGLEQQKFQQGQTDKTDLTPEGLDAAAMMFAKTGQLPALGIGDKGTRKAIINRAAVMVPGLDVASAKADFEANRKSLDNITGTLDSLEAFSNTGKKNLQQFVDLIGKVPDTGVPWVNTPIRLLNDKMVGADYAPAVNLARSVAAREFSRIANDPKLKGALTDNARQEMDALVPQDITVNQLKKLVPVMLNDMNNAHTSLTDQKTAIASRIKLGSSAPDMKPQATEGTVQPIPGFPGMEQTFKNGKWIRTK